VESDWLACDSLYECSGENELRLVCHCHSLSVGVVEFDEETGGPVEVKPNADVTLL